MSPSLVSIIIPTYNRQELIKECLNSLISQTYKNWEAIVVDDISTDNTIDLIQEYGLKDNRIKLFVRNRNPKGAATCRNIGIEKANGYYLIFLDSDDILAPYCLEERIKYFHKYNDNDFIVFNGSFFHNNLGDSNLLWNKFTNEVDLIRFLRGDTVWSMIGPIWKTKNIKKLKLQFNENALSSQDWEFHVKALLKKLAYKKISGLPDYFVRRSNSVFSDNISKSHHQFNKINNRLKTIDDILNQFRLSRFQESRILKNLSGQLFHSYRLLTFHQLKTILQTISEYKALDKYKLLQLKIYFYFLFLSFKVIGNKSHTLFYKIKKLRHRRYITSNYRTQMNDNDYQLLKTRLEITD